MALLIESCFGWEVRQYTKQDIDNNPLWCSGLLINNRDTCVKAYRSLIKAGADLITTASYQATVDGLIKYCSLSKQSALEVIADSVKVSKEALALEEKEQGKKLNVKICGTVGSYGAFLHNGSEYNGLYPDSVSNEFLKEWHRDRVETLVSSGVDLLWFFTQPRLDEALVLVELLKEQPSHIKGSLTFSCKQAGFISDGTPWVEAASKVWDASEGRLLAVGFNCCHPEIVLKQSQLLTMKRPDIPFAAIPNSGEVFDTVTNRWLDKEGGKSLIDYTEEYLKHGVKYVGCCCRNYAEDVQQIREKIDQLNMNKNVES